MSTVKVAETIKKVQVILQDKTSVRWPEQELLDWFNLAQQDIVNHRPDSKSETLLFECNEGTRQVIPAQALRLIAVQRNEDSGKQVYSVITQVEQDILDQQHEDWHNPSRSADKIQHYTYDDRLPKEFMLFPGAKAGHKIRIAICTAPVFIKIEPGKFDTDDQVIGLDDTYVNPIMDYMLYRAYSKNVDFGQGNLAMAAYQSYANALGIKAQMDRAISPQPEITSSN